MADFINDRERGEERKYEMDQEMQFRVEARRNKLLGEWLAGEFSMGPAETEEYVKQVIIADLEEPGTEDVVRKILADIFERGGNISEEKIREKIIEFDIVAARQLHEEG